MKLETHGISLYIIYNLDSRESHIYDLDKNGGKSKDFMSPLVPGQSMLAFLTASHVNNRSFHVPKIKWERIS